MTPLRPLAALAAASAMSVATAAATPAPAVSSPLLPPLTATRLASASAVPPSLATCRKEIHLSCYRPQHLQTAYDLSPLYGQGLTGAGRKIVIVDAYGSPSIHHDLTAYDQAFGLHDPPSFRVIKLGKIPRYDPFSHSRRSWATETSLDVELAHAMAPDASIVLLEVAPGHGDTTVKQLRPLVDAVHYALDHHLGDVISLSFGVSEPTFTTRRELWPLHHVFTLAKQRHVTILAASGDTGAAGPRGDGSCCYSSRVTTWPASDPYVTAVGATKLHLDDAGNRTAPDTAWKDPAGASGGGVSVFFGRPIFQQPIDHTRPRGRSVPDVSMSGSFTGASLVYTSFRQPIGHSAGFALVGGTSVSAPLFAGIVAIADQAAGHRLGFLNPSLYSSGVVGSGGLVDVIGLNNSFSYKTSGGRHKVNGFRATPGYDLVTGLGTVDAARLVPALIAAR